MRDPACAGKTRFLTFDAARQVQKRMRRRKGKEGQRLVAYRCPECRGFHLGNTKAKGWGV